MRGLALLIAAALVLGACGKRGTPRPPQAAAPAPTEAAPLPPGARGEAVLVPPGPI